MNFGRACKHVFYSTWEFRRCFPEETMAAIERAVAESERSHAGQVVVVIEPALDIHRILRGQTPRERALEVFSHTRVWDTHQNCGVLIYLLLADRDVEILADRGVHTVAGQPAWDAICGEMEQLFKQEQFQKGVMIGIERVTKILQTSFPKSAANPNELPDRPVTI
jgi:uncharacterized membrane protein